MVSMPNAGARALKMRDASAMLNEKDKQLHLLPQDNTYLTLASQAADYNVRGGPGGGQHGGGAFGSW